MGVPIEKLWFSGYGEAMKNVAILALLLTTSASPNYVVIEDNQGGVIEEFVAQRWKYEHDGTQIRFSKGCVSACTIFTGLKNTCVMPGAFFKFHQGWEKPPMSRGTTTRTMLRLMNPNFRKEIESAGEPMPTFESEDFWIIEGDDAVKLGWMKPCPT